VLIEIWSDVVCPWCYIGKRRLEEALASFPHADEVEVVYRSFALDPTAPAVATETVEESLARKLGATVEQARVMMDRTAGIAAEVGLQFDHAGAPHTSTGDAHRLIHLARAQGDTPLQRRLKEALLDAFLVRGRSMGDQATLREVAVSVGLDPERTDEVLASDEYAADVRADVEQAHAYGITGVPFFVVDRKYGVAGAQPTEVFTQVLERAWSEGGPGLQVMADGSVCGPDGCAV
jgi:predicted DsbA family dithiol-disulfide isomerase